MGKSAQGKARSSSEHSPSAWIHSNSRWLKGPMASPNRIVFDTYPSAACDRSRTWNGPSETPPEPRSTGAPPRGWARQYDWVAWSMHCWALTSTCWPRPDNVRSRRAMSDAAAASAEAWRNAWSRGTRNGGRSRSPIMAMCIPAAAMVRSVACQSALGPV